LDANPALCRMLLVRTSRRLMERDLMISRMSRASVRERVAHTLLLLEAAHGKKTKAGVKLELSLSREEIAQLTGTVHESVVRVLSDFKKEGIIRLQKREITILDPTALRKIYNPSFSMDLEQS
jgi:CRP/FNR family transcriptional regulator